MIDDTTLTAYALNELNAADRAAVEAHLAENPAAQQTVADIEATASLITTELAGELQATPLPLPIQLPPRRRTRWATAAIGVAATAAIAAGVGMYVHHIEQRAQDTSIAAAIKPFPEDPLHPAPGTGPVPAVTAAQPPVDGEDLLHAPTNTDARPRDPHDRIPRDQTVAGLIQDARQYCDEGKYTEALAVVDNIHHLDPNNPYANDVRQMVEDKANNQTQRQAGTYVDREFGRTLDDATGAATAANGYVTSLGSTATAGANGPASVSVTGLAASNPNVGNPSQHVSTAAYDREFSKVLNDAKETVVPYEDIIRYAPDWPKISALRDDETRADRGESFEVGALQAKLDQHLPELRFNQNSLSDVIDFLRDVSGSNIYVDWPALEKAGLKQDTPVTARLRDIKMSEAIALILKSAGNGTATAGYKLDNGTICISVGPDYRLDNPIVTVNNESYSRIIDNPFLSSKQSPLSTFAVDVDTASYSNVRRFLEQGQLPPADAVRIEELINYFPYDNPGPKAADPSPINVNVEVADCPWQPSHRLARVALKAKALPAHKRPPSNLVFLLDISGSMADENKLPLLKTSLKKLVNRLSATDHVSIVTYASTTQVLLPSTACGDDSVEANADTTTELWRNVYEPQLILKNGTPVNLAKLTAAYKADVRNLQAKSSGRQQILSAIDCLNADGSTDGGDGIQLAYNTAVANFNKEGTNRVILATDGDFNVGIIDPTQLTQLIEKEATTGVYLTVLGVGMGNVKDSTMEKLADHGKGNYAYLDSVEEADKVLGRQIDGTLVTVAKDVKLQIEFNPNTVAAYRLIGYEDRAMANKDFNNDKKTAGEMGAGHTVTALYEMVPANNLGHTVALKYQPAPTTNPADNELMTVNVRYQPPEGGESRKLEFPVTDNPEASANASSDFRFSAAVASFGMILRNSPYRGCSTIDQVLDQANGALGEDVGGYRKQFLELVRRAKSIAAK